MAADGDRSVAGRVRRAVVRFSGLGTTLIASGFLLFVPVPDQRPPAGPVPAVLAWPAAQRGLIPATLPDRTAYLTGNVQLIVYELTTRRTVEISPDASSISYSAGVLWWSVGTRDAFVRHTIDLRTV